MKRSLLALTLGFALFATGCGDDEDTASTTTMDESADMSDGDMDGEMSEMNMGDPDATPAADVAGAEVQTGSFVLLDTRPEGYDDVTGDAAIARSDAGTTVTIELTGLIPGEEYISHLHESSCDDNGGDHYQFDPEGGDMPPNEIHLAFTADADGNGFMTAENDQVAGPDGVAVVVHPVGLLDNKIACADFSA